MNFQQLEYIIALDREKHFAKAAKVCFVAQPTLSMMIQKLEEEIGAMIFDRSSHPIAATKQGSKIIEQAKVILNNRQLLFEIVQEEKTALTGDLSIGIIPTLAPYLLPLFIDSFTHKYAGLQLRIEEDNTGEIVRKIKTGELDLGILATPLAEANIDELPLFYEKFFLYGNEDVHKAYILPSEIDFTRLLLLEEGHCLRSQVINLCELREKKSGHLLYKVGSLETLKKLVEKNQGITILPELAVLDLDPAKKKRVIRFREPEPVREISIIKHKSFIKEKMLRILQAEILAALPKAVKGNSEVNLVMVE